MKRWILGFSAAVVGCWAATGQSVANASESWPSRPIKWVVPYPPGGSTDILARILGLKQDAGSGALEQMVLAEYCRRHFDDHIPVLAKALHAKLQTLREALAEQFGTAAEFGDPPGGIYLWIKLPDTVDTVKLAQAAQAAS